MIAWNSESLGVCVFLVLRNIGCTYRALICCFFGDDDCLKFLNFMVCAPDFLEYMEGGISEIRPHTETHLSLSHQNPTLAFSSLSLASLSLTYTHLLFSSRLSLTCFSFPLSLSLYSLSLSVCDSLCVMSWTANHTKWVLAVQQWPSTAPTVFFFFFTTNPRAAASLHPYQVSLSLSLSLSFCLFSFYMHIHVPVLLCFIFLLLRSVSVHVPALFPSNHKTL